MIELVSGIAPGEDFDADVGSHAQRRLAGIMARALLADPGDVGDADFAVCCFDRAFRDDTALGKQGAEKMPDFVLIFSVPRTGRAHFQDPSPGELDLEGQVTESWIGADFTPGKNRRHGNQAA